MSRNPEIIHEGIVTGIEGESVNIMLTPGSACTGCRAEGSCSVYGDDVKIIKMESRFTVHPGQKVMVSMSESQGFRALFLGYVLPLILVLFILVLCISLSVGELASGLIAIGSIATYYFVLFLCHAASLHLLISCNHFYPSITFFCLVFPL